MVLAFAIVLAAFAIAVSSELFLPMASRCAKNGHLRIRDEEIWRNGDQKE